jgi:hypothetical protein
MEVLMKRIALTAAALSFALAAPALAAPNAATPAMQRDAGMAAMSQIPAAPQASRMTAALNALEANGYGDFSNFKPDGSNFSATVTRNGKQATVVVDPDTGQVTRQS